MSESRVEDILTATINDTEVTDPSIPQSRVEALLMDLKDSGDKFAVSNQGSQNAGKIWAVGNNGDLTLVPAGTAGVATAGDVSYINGTGYTSGSVGAAMETAEGDITQLKSDIANIANNGTVGGAITLGADDLEQGAWSTDGIYSAASYRVRTKNSYSVSAGAVVSVAVTSGYKAVVRLFANELDGTTSQTQLGTSDWKTVDINYVAPQSGWAIVTIGNTSDTSISVSDAANNVTITVPGTTKIHSEIRLDGVEEDIADINDDIADINTALDDVPMLEITYQNLYNKSTMVVGYDKAYDKTGTIEGKAVNLIDLNQYTAIKIPLPGNVDTVALKMTGSCKLWGWYAVDADMIITSAYGSRIDPAPLLNAGYVLTGIPATAKYLCLSVLYYEEYEDNGDFLMVCAGSTPKDYRPYVAPWYEIDNFKADVIPDVQDQIDANTAHRQWVGRAWAQYGNSISTYAEMPNSVGWADIPNAYHHFAHSYMRGIGGQSFAFGTHGGSVAFINADGSLNSVNQSYNYDNYTGTVPSGTTKSRGAFCSWLRITLMFPASIKDNVDLIFVMGGTNDTASDTAPTWVANSSADTEWAASDYYAGFGGDYNIDTLQGGVASTIMKMHAWMPNALIVIGTPLNGRTDIIGGKKPGTIPTEYQKSNQIIAAARMFGANVIDVFGGCGINVANSDEYISDGVHPNAAGRTLLGAFIAGELNRIYPPH